jgi:RimJ/RimL family protein N-acetyltransferase
MEFHPITKDTVELLYSWYKEDTEPIYFRHMPDGLELEPFALSLDIAGLLLEIIDKELIGVVHVTLRPRPKLAEIAIMLLPEYRGQKKALETMKQLMDSLYEDRIHKVVVNVSRDDVETVSALEKGGFRVEARLRDNCFYSGKLHDELRLSMTANKFKELYKGV